MSTDCLFSARTKEGVRSHETDPRLCADYWDAGIRKDPRQYLFRPLVVALKAETVTGPPLTVTLWEVGVKVILGSFGVTVYVPGATFVKP